MGYARIVQYADITEYYEYDKDFRPPRRRKKPSKRSIQKFKSEFSARRARRQFVKVVTNTLYERGCPLLVTLTTHVPDVQLTEGYKFIRQFKEHVKSQMGKTFTYIAVPEWQKNGRLHFHLLCWGLLSSREEAEAERHNRNLQRCYGRGFLDVRFANDSSPKLAGYLGKYMSKAYQDERLAGRKAYTSSRDVDKVRTHGSNALSTYSDELIPNVEALQQTHTYETMYLGRCRVSIYKTNIEKVK